MGEELTNNRRRNHKIKTIESFDDLYYFAYGDVYKSCWDSNLNSGTNSKSSNIPRITKKLLMSQRYARLNMEMD